MPSFIINHKSYNTIYDSINETKNRIFDSQFVSRFDDLTQYKGLLEQRQHKD